MGCEGEGDRVGDAVAVGVGDVGVGVAEGETDGAGASVMPIAVSADDDQYEFDPSKLAMIVYLPSMGGCHKKLNIPLVSLVAEPMSCVLPFGPIAVNFTVTPVAFSGIGFCI